VSKTRPKLSVALQRKPALERFNSFGQSSFLLIRSTQEAVVKPVIRIQVDGITQLLDRLVPLVRKDQNRAQVSIKSRGKWIDLQRLLRFFDGLVPSPHRRQEPGIVSVSIARVWVQFNGSFEFSFRSTPRSEE